MNRTKIKLIAVVLWMTVVACASQYAHDPNANTVVTVQYENEPERIILFELGKKTQVECAGKTEKQCAIFLYNSSYQYITEAEEMYQKKYYLSASVSYMQAMTRLVEAEIRLKGSGEETLQKTIKKKINFCRMKVKKMQHLDSLR